jgi:hypothetical protein
MILLICCNGCRSGRVPNNKQSPYPNTELIMEYKNIKEDTTSQEWKDKNYYRGTHIRLPDSLKTNKGLGKRFWYVLPDSSYKAIVFDDANDPGVQATRIHFMDSLSKKAILSLTLYEHNPYNDLPFTRISGERLMKVDGIIRYDLKDKTREELRPFLMEMGVNIDTVLSRIVGAEVMTGNNSPEERTALANAYAIQVLDEEGKIIANQTTYKIYNRYGKKTGEIKENGHGLYQFAVTRDGKHLGSVFGGRYGCRSGQYLKPYFIIFETESKHALHKEDIDLSEGVTCIFNYIVLNVGGSPKYGYSKKIYDLETKIVYEGGNDNTPKIPLLKREGWKQNSIFVNGKNRFFSDPEFFSSQPFQSKK